MLSLFSTIERVHNAFQAGRLVLRTKSVYLWNAAVLAGLAVTLTACGGRGSRGIPPPNTPFEMLYTPSGSQVGMLQVDPSTGALGAAKTISLDPAATFVSIALDPQDKFIFVADNPNVPSTASVHVLSITQSSGALTEVNGSPFLTVVQAGIGQGSLGQLAIDPTGQFLYVAINSTSGSAIESFTVDRTTGALASIGVFGNIGPNGVSVLLVHPSGKFLYAADNNGHIVGFAVGTGGALTPVSGSPFLVAGFMYDMSLHPSGKFLFAGEKLTSTAQGGFEVWSVDNTTGALQEISAAPVSSGDLTSGVLLMDPEGKFLYTVGASADIRAYGISSTTGQLTAGTASPASIPFTIFVSASIDPQGKFIFLSGAKPNALAVFAINSATGSATSAGTAPTLPFSPSEMTIAKLP
jgi:6-phosphogluconolactonase (cycloisomerase 2 family)